VAVPSTMDPGSWLVKHLESEDGDLLREMIKTFAEVLMSAEAQAMCNAGYGEVSSERTNSRNGYRSREFDTRAGTIELVLAATLSAHGVAAVIGDGSAGGFVDGVGAGRGGHV
jgi:putative transposase